MSDLSVNIFADLNPVIIGSDLTYDVFVTNNGPSLATNLTITDTLPANVTFVSATSNGRSSTAVNGVVTANVGDLRSGETASLRIVVRPNVVGLISNTARASADQADPADANNTATINTTVSPPVPADLLVASFASSTQATVGDEFMYTVVIANNGPSNEAAGVVLTDILPAGSTFVSATLSQGTFAVADNTLTATLGSLPRGANATVQLTVRLNVAGRATNRATVRGAQADPNFLNNTSTLETPVLPPAAADLAIFAGAQPEPARVGRPLTYSIIVSNRGPGDATGVVLTDELDPAVTLVSATASQGTASSDGSTVTANFGTLIVGQSVLVTIVVRPTAIGTLTNTASVRADQTDFNPTNNVVTTTSRVDEEANPPILLAQRLTVTRKAITGIVLTFSEPLDLIQAEALNNYRLVPSGKNGPSSAQQHSPIAIASAVYNASRRTVTLTPQQPLPLGRFYQLTVNGRGASGTTDPTGNVLDGDRNGLPDGIYASILGRGTSVRPVQFQRDQNVPIPPPAGRLRSTPQGPARRLTQASSSVRTESLFTRTSVKQVNRTTT